MTNFQSIKDLDDKTLVTCLATLAGAERQNQVELLLHLAELDQRQLYLGQGYSSLWDYCRRALHFSESMSQQRIVVARAIGRYPFLLEPLKDGRLTLCTAADLVPALTAENAAMRIAQASFKSRREVQALADTKGAKPRERDVIRRLAATQPALDLVQVEADAKRKLPPDNSSVVTAQPTAYRHRVAFTASEDVAKKLERLKELLGAATLEDAVSRAADALLDRLDPVRREHRRHKRLAKVRAVPTPRRVISPKKEPRRPPLPLRDAIFVRDKLRCTFVSSDGVRCKETRFLTIDHHQPYALGGSSTDQRNLRSMCAAHNGYLGRQVFGLREMSVPDFD